MNKDNKKNNTPKKQNEPVPQKSISKRIFNIKTLKILLTVILLVFLAGGGIVTAMVLNFIKDAPSFDPRYLRPAETSYVYDNNNREVAQLHHEQNRTVIPLDEIPDHVQEAFIAIEDERFKSHFGVDIMGIIRATIVNIRQKGIQQGASTITQQLIRNAFLTPDQTLERKIQEAWLAIQIEQEYTKQEILEMYLNIIYFGNGVYGVEAASETYFNKTTGELTVAESAMLAGIPSSPNFNNPIHSEERAVNRMITVINKMESLGYISSQEASEARETEEFNFGEVRSIEYPYPYFVDYVLHHELVGILSEMPEYGNKENAYSAIYNQGLRVYTTLDAELQKHVEATLNRSDKYPTTIRINMVKFREAFIKAGNKIPSDYPGAYIDQENGVPQPQSAIVMANPSNGEIRALGGGREYSKRTNEVLRFISRRQPGSSIKPLISYAPAFEEGVLTPGSIVYDVPFRAGSYAPRNYDRKFEGPITVRHALKWSRNIPAVSVLQQISPGIGTGYAERMGITTFSDDDRGSLAAALGGVSGISAMDMAQAFSTIANEGIKKPLHTVRRIEDRDGNIIYQQNSAGERVLSAQTAYMVNDILEDAHRTTFTRNRLYIDRPVAAKTGTTNDNRDTYLVTYTPNAISVFWMGYDYKEMGRILSGHGYSISVTRDVLAQAFKGLEVMRFNRPPGLISMEICSLSGEKPTELCRAADSVTTEMFTSRNVPRGTCEDHEEIGICSRSGLLAGSFCPPDSIKKEVFFTGKHTQDEIPDKSCNVHTQQPEGPSSFSANWDSSLQAVILTWSPPDEDIREFRIFRSSDSEDRSLLANVSASLVSHIDSENMVGGTRYTYTLHTVNKQGVLSEPLTATVTVPGDEITAPPPPILSSPSDGSTGTSVTPTFLWQSSRGALSYTIEISENESFSSTVLSISVNRTAITISQSLDHGTLYYWRVRAAGNSGTSEWSRSRTFTTAEQSQEHPVVMNFFRRLYAAATTLF